MDWSVSDVAWWAINTLDAHEKLTYTSYSKLMLGNEVSGMKLLTLTDSELADMGVAAAEHREVILEEIYRLKLGEASGAPVVLPARGGGGGDEGAAAAVGYATAAAAVAAGGAAGMAAPKPQMDAYTLEDMGDGAMRGGEGFGRGLVDGVTGLVTAPMKAFDDAETMGKDGVDMALEVAKGVGDGVVGLMVKPIDGTLSLTSELATGFRNSSALLDGALRGNDHGEVEAAQAPSEPEHLGDGFIDGVKGLTIGVVDGVVDFFVQPVLCAREEAAKPGSDAGDIALGALKGFGVGLTSLITKPVAGTLDLVVGTTQGLLNTPGAIADGVDKMMEESKPAVEPSDRAGASLSEQIRAAGAAERRGPEKALEGGPNPFMSGGSEDL